MSRAFQVVLVPAIALALLVGGYYMLRGDTPPSDLGQFASERGAGEETGDVTPGRGSQDVGLLLPLGTQKPDNNTRQEPGKPGGVDDSAALARDLVIDVPSQGDAMVPVLPPAGSADAASKDSPVVAVREKDSSTTPDLVVTPPPSPPAPPLPVGEVTLSPASPGSPSTASGAAPPITAREPAPPISATPDPITRHTIESGDSFWALAQRYYGDGSQWTRIYEANRDVVSSPSELRVGTVLKIPPGTSAQPQR